MSLSMCERQTAVLADTLVCFNATYKCSTKEDLGFTMINMPATSTLYLIMNTGGVQSNLKAARRLLVWSGTADSPIDCMK